MSKNKTVVTYEVDGNRIDLTPERVQEFLLNGQANITTAEFKMFSELCKVRKLNPFLKEAYIIKYGTQPAQIVIGKDAILRRAVKHSQFNGREQGVIIQKNDGSIEERKGTFKMQNELLVGGWAKVYRKDWEYPVYITVAFDEVAQRKNDGTLNANWAYKGATMVEKVALMRALREAFVEEFGGMIDEDEAWRVEELSPRATKKDIVDQPDPTEYEVIDMEEI